MERENGFGLNKYIERAPAGVTFALPQTDVHVSFKDTLLRLLENADWSQYYGRPSDAIARGPLGWVERDGLEAHFTAGAEAAILGYARQVRPRRLLCPRYSYPGYARIASALGVSLHTYDQLDYLLELAGPSDQSDALIILTVPGNPLDCSVRPEVWQALARFDTLVDCAYEPPDTRKFRDYTLRASEFDMPVVHSMAKSYPLAGFRLGGLICRPGNRHASFLEKRFWTALSCAAMEALADPDVHDLLLKQREDQHHLRNRILSLLQAQGHSIQGSESDLFVTVDYSPKLSDLEFKPYGKKRFMRIDCSRENLSALEI